MTAAAVERVPALPTVACALHATAVAIGARALLILGPSRSGKSRLARLLIEASSPSRPVRLLGDDRILITPHGGALIASPHPRIAGFVERRGLGIVAMPFVPRAPIAGVATLAEGWLRQAVATGGVRLIVQSDLPVIALAQCATEERVEEVLDWWSRGCSAA